MCDLILGGFGATPNTPNTAEQTFLANNNQMNLAFPFSGEGIVGSFFSSYFSSGQQVVANAVNNTAQQSLATGATSNVYVDSGSYGLLAQVWPTLPSNVQNNISITLVSPGQVPSFTSNSLLGRGPIYTGSNSLLDNLVVASTGYSGDMGGIGGGSLPCGHVANCEFQQLSQLGVIPAQNSSPCPTQTTFTRQNPSGGGSGNVNNNSGGPGGPSFGPTGGGTLINGYWACVSAGGSTVCSWYPYNSQ